MKKAASVAAVLVAPTAAAFLLSLHSGSSASAAVSSLREIIACSTATDCLNVDNLTSGRAISAFAHKALAIQGTTTAVNAPFAISNGIAVQQSAGVVGNDFATDPFTDTNAGVIGFSKVTNGVIGYTENNVACLPCGTDVFSSAVQPATAGLDAGPFTGFSGGVTNVGVVGLSLGRAGVMGLTQTGWAVVGRSLTTGTGVLGVARGVGGTALAARTLKGGPIFRAFNATKEVASIDANGNMLLAGTLHTSSTPTIATPSETGESVTAYGARETMPTIEDFGQAQLQSGIARVQIDPAFAHVMDKRTPYMVFLSPEGENRGLYITSKSALGFTVRESFAGRSSLTFSYRLVAHAYASETRRLNIEPALSTIPAVHERPKVRLAHHYMSE